MKSQVTVKRTVFNIASQWGSHVASIAVGFFLIGYVVAQVGAEHYGGWASIISIIGYLSLLDVSMSVAIQHYVARFAAKDEKDNIAAIFSSAYIVYGATAVVALVVWVILSMTYSDIFPKIPAQAAVECSVALRWVALAMFFVILNYPMQGMLLGLQWHSVRNTIEVFSLLVRAGVVVVAFRLFGVSLSHLGAALFAASLSRFTLNLITLRIIEPCARFRFSSVSRSAIRQLFSFGGHSIVWNLCKTVIRETGPIIATALLSPAAATYLYIATRLASAAGTFVITAGEVFVPIASSLQSAGDVRRLQSALIRGTRFCALLGFSAAAVLIVFGRPLLDHWVGPGQTTTYLVVVVVTAGMCGIWVFRVALSILVGMRTLWPLTIMHSSRVVLGLILAFVLARFWGAVGLAAGLMIPLIPTSFVWVPFYACRRTGVTMSTLFARGLPGPLGAAVVLAGVAWALKRVWPPDTVWILVSECALMLLLFAALALLWGLDGASRSLIMDRIRTRLAGSRSGGV